MNRYTDIMNRILSAFASRRTRYEIPVKGDVKRYRDLFYKAMRRRGLYWLLSVEQERGVLHVINPRSL